MPIRLVIKGTPDDARKAASARNVAITDIKQGHHGCTTAKAGDRFAKVVWDWYHSRNTTATARGYEPGSLLVYRER